MKPPVLDYQRPLPRKLLWLPSARVFAVVAGSLFDLALGAILSGLTHAAIGSKDHREQTMLPLMIFAVQVFVFMFIISAATVARTFGRNADPWWREHLIAVCLPQVIAILMPVCVVLVDWSLL